jgi:4-aminobutyrate--pyruvate transaminase
MLPANHRSFDLPFDFVRYAECPHYYRAGRTDEDEAVFSERMGASLAALIEAEGPDRIAAMIAEPLQGAGGVILPPRGYWEQIGKVLKRYAVPLIVDEVITGFGRTGKWFGSETYAMKPASMTIAKALSSAYLPISAVLLGDELAAAVEAESGRIGTFGHGFTYGGHPVACAVALKTIEIYQTRDVVGHAARMAPHFLQHLQALGTHPLVGEAQGVGLIGGIELVADKQSRKSFEGTRQVAMMAARFAQEEGVIVRPLMGDRLAICPPLVIVEAEIDELFARLRRGLDRALEWVRTEGLLRG